jgi:hypothetical protein
MLTCYRSLKNSQQSPLLKFPQELLDKIYEYVFDDQVLNLTIVKGRIGLLDATNAHPLGLPLTCRKIYQDTKDQIMYAKVTLRIVTFNYISLIDSWDHPIISDVQMFLDVLKASPHIDHFEIIGVRCRVSDRSEKFDHLSTQVRVDFDWDINYKAELKRTLKRVYPDATYSCRMVDGIH